MADLENAQDPKVQLETTKTKVDTQELMVTEVIQPSKFRRTIEAFARISGLETRGIEPVPIDERLPSTSNNYIQIFLLWLSSSLTGNNILVGLYGPSFYGLNWTDAAICAVFGVFLGSFAVGYMSTWGPRSGNRTLVMTRYFVGYYLSKVFCVLNILTMLGYAMVNDILGGQIIFTISNGHTGISAGIIIVAVISWFIATVGMHIFQLYSRYAWIIQLSVLSVMVGCAGPSFDTSSPVESSPPSASQRLSFVSLCFASAITWSPSSADYFVYFPPSTKPWRMFLAASTGMGLAMTLTALLGIGLATGIPTNPVWSNAADVSQGSLLAVSFAPLHSFGHVCAVMVLLSAVSNNIPCTYSAGLNLQMMLGRYGPSIPRPVLTTIEVVVHTVCAIVAHRYLREIIENFLPLMSYWIVIWLAVCMEEVWIFQPRNRDVDWTVWNSPRKLPMGLAAAASFVFGCLGAVLGMSQSYFTGPIARALSQPTDLVVVAFGTMATYLRDYP
ncbi:hypothetical protein FE257_010914 [Aspergillus nanangensis]|uniref:Uncharacterized protein n=1 Tax=Aspergillus nanangensis TaxID=2582783 RepID=A0AAD4CW82_ASPNN|nr:hypothetical protein FE257_010914 [Aspergillus nanangensis]